ncbi:hypothetical protein BJ742DRAFT_791266 [Cladochytrium replicatum]|nr:hypothetical protein BJ742DRAFT_791266 [Cladochytrium replicatum]
MAQLLRILDRLLEHNIIPPSAPAKENVSGGWKSNGNGAPDKDWELVSSEDDEDAKEPLWHSLFVDFFLQQENADLNDDLLFFVRANSAPNADVELDPVFVRRKVSSDMPALDDVVSWKQTFFLNLIVQLACTLTVAVCKRATNIAAADSERKSRPQTVILPRGAPLSSLNAPTEGNPAYQKRMSFAHPSPLQDGASVDGDTDVAARASSPSPSMPRSQSQAKPKSRMTALRRITKKVYAAPYKSRMDVKDAFMNECSWPLVYYTVNDYESNDLHLPIFEGEYLCVELSVLVPEPNGPYSDTLTLPTEALAEVPLESDNSPFPTPPGVQKIVLFQGAVPYGSLIDIYQQKGMVAHNQLRFGWNKFGSMERGSRNSYDANAGGSGQSANPAPIAAAIGAVLNNFGLNLQPNPSGSPSQSLDTVAYPERTEYIMMRGPNGKGQCQVAITENPTSSTNDGATASGSANSSTQNLSTDATRQSTPSGSNLDITGKSPPSTMSLAERWKQLSESVKVGLASAQQLASSQQAKQQFAPLTRLENLRCSMTYVNIPWNSIIAYVE